jgi:hypothetical protein
MIDPRMIDVGMLGVHCQVACPQRRGGRQRRRLTRILHVRLVRRSPTTPRRHPANHPRHLLMRETQPPRISPAGGNAITTYVVVVALNNPHPQAYEPHHFPRTSTHYPSFSPSTSAASPSRTDREPTDLQNYAEASGYLDDAQPRQNVTISNATMGEINRGPTIEKNRASGIYTLLAYSPEPRLPRQRKTPRSEGRGAIDDSTHPQGDVPVNTTVELRRFELLTSSMRTKRSTN